MEDQTIEPEGIASEEAVGTNEDEDELEDLGEPEETDNGPRPEDGEQDVDQSEDPLEE